MTTATRNLAFLSDFFSVTPALYTQQDVVDWTVRYVTSALGTTDETSTRERLNRYGVSSDKIATRGFECANVTKSSDADSSLLYQVGQDTGSGPLLEKRSAFFLKKSNEVFEKFYSLDARKPNHIVHVTCSGYVSPSAPQRLVVHKKWDTDVTHAYHMGCYAALPAVRSAAALVTLESPTNSSFAVDVAHTEICSLHLNPQLETPEQTIVQTLFADGHIKYTLSAQQPRKGFAVHKIKERQIPNSAEEMTWQPEHYGFRMTLGRNVPALIRSHIRPFVQDLLDEVGWDLADVLKNAVFAIHPGGPRIIDFVQEALELQDRQTAESKDILLTRGNMSSATLPHVWQRLLAQNTPVGTKVISLAFGPGLTVFGAAFTVV